MISNIQKCQYLDCNDFCGPKLTFSFFVWDDGSSSQDFYVNCGWQCISIMITHTMLIYAVWWWRWLRCHTAKEQGYYYLKRYSRFNGFTSDDRVGSEMLCHIWVIFIDTQYIDSVKIFRVLINKKNWYIIYHISQNEMLFIVTVFQKKSICIFAWCTDACIYSHLCKPLYQTNISDILSIHIAHSINVQFSLGTIRNDDIHVTYMQ